MDNYLSYRWPSGSNGGMPMPPDPDAPKKKHRKLRLFLKALLVLITLGVLLYMVITLTLMIARLVNFVQHQPSAEGSQPPAMSSAEPLESSTPMETPASDWTPEDLPWAQPNENIQLSTASTGKILSAKDIYDSCLPGVVRVTTEHQRSNSIGSGFIVESNGYILTNYHVIDQGLKIEVSLLTDLTFTYDAQVVGYDEAFDIAVLKIDARNLPVLPLGDSDLLSVGDMVYAIGNPMGYLTGSMSDGIVSAIDRESVEDTAAMAMIQTTAPLNGGNSGGPLLNDKGQVVGMVSAKITGIEDEKVIEGLGLALPISDMLPFVNRILTTGESWRPYIGITCYAGRYESRAGIIVDSVIEGVPADKAGVRAGDFIWAANGQRVTSMAALRRVLYRTGVGGEVTINLKRGFDEMVITFALIDSSEVPS